MHDLTPEMVARLASAAHLGKVTAARRVGIHPRTLSRWLKAEGPQFDLLRRAYWAAQADDAEQLIAEAKLKDPVKMLSVLHGIREKERKQSGLTGDKASGNTINVIVLARELASLPDAERNRRLSEGARDVEPIETKGE